MNYIWDLVIKAGHEGMQKKNIKFKAAQSYSPYMELSPENINSSQVELEAEVNPYYRFYEIFKDLFNINNMEDNELRNIFFDVAVHFLTDIDIRQGMNKKEYYLRFILRDIENEILGSYMRERMELFEPNEKDVIVSNILRLYINGEAFYLLKDTIRKIFNKSKIYANYETKDELLFFMDHERNDINEAKLEFIKDIFLPIKFRTEVYWREHFGIIDVEETMKIDRIALY